MNNMMDENFPFYLMIFGAAVVAVQSIIGMMKEASNKAQINRRLRVSDGTKSISEVILQLRQERGLTNEGEIRSGWSKLNELVTRSGLAITPLHLIFAILGLAIISAVASYYFLQDWRLSIPIGIAIGPTIPLLYLSNCVSSRSKLLGKQLPDALEIINRSLEAGHPVPVAVSLVGREMPDPIGTEFGMAADEISYGSSLPEAIRKMALRVRHPDIDLFAATVRVQEKTGGNLSGLLRANADTVRARQKMRLKVKAASSEGRASAIILTSAPFLVGLAMHFLTPEFYGEVIDQPIIMIGLGCFFVWMVIGNLVMRQMINFKV